MPTSKTTKERAMGRQPIRKSAADDRLNLRLTPELREKLEQDADKAGIAPTELMRRKIESDANLADVSEAIQLAFAQHFGEGVPLILEGISRERLSEIARELGFLDPSHLLRVLASKAVADPEAIRALLSDVGASVKSEARAEQKRRVKGAIQ